MTIISEPVGEREIAGRDIAGERLNARESAIHRFSRGEYLEIARLGFFDEQRVELIAGEILDMSPQNEPHAVAISIIDRYLHRGLPDGYVVRCQLPMSILAAHAPEPDFAVVVGEPAEVVSHPSTARLVIEIADTSAKRDRRKKSLYAAAMVQEYWIINLAERQIEVYTLPMVEGTAEFGADYTQVKTFSAAETVTTTAVPLPAVVVSQLLPRE